MTAGRAAALAGVLALAAASLAVAQMAPPAPASPSPMASPSTASPSPGASPAASASPKPLANTLKWSTASEVENFGYDVYRADKEDGPWVRINATPIPGAGTLDEPSFYQYIDTDIDPTRSYYYYVESISLKGVREKFTPVIHAPPKRPPPGTPQASPSIVASPSAGPAAPPSPSATAHPPVLPSPSPPPGGRR